jgi:hypothetical protein
MGAIVAFPCEGADVSATGPGPADWQTSPIRPSVPGWGRHTWDEIALAIDISSEEARLRFNADSPAADSRWPYDSRRARSRHAAKEIHKGRPDLAHGLVNDTVHIAKQQVRSLRSSSTEDHRGQVRPPLRVIIHSRDDDASEEVELHPEATPNARGRLINRLPGGPAVLVQPELPPVSDPEPLHGLRADEGPQRAHEPDVTATGQANHRRRPVNGNEHCLHGR